MKERDFIDAGLYDPDAPDAAARRDLLDLLVGHGATLEQLRAASARGRLASLAGDLVAGPGHERFTLDGAAERLQLDPDRVRRVLLAAGLTIDRDDPLPLTSRDLEAIEAFEVGSALLGDDVALAFTRLLGNSAARVAEAATEIFTAQIAARLDPDHSTELDHGQASAEAMGLMRLVPEAFDDLLSRHLRWSVRRTLSEATETDPDCVHTTIGFVDLVGSTSWTRHLSTVELARALVTFEAAAFDLATTHGGWVVKLIGDAAMFEARDPVAATRIGLELCAEVERCSELPGARGGLAAGQVQARDGDYFGTVVNLAARAAGVSERCTLAVNDVVAGHLQDHADDGIEVDPMAPHALRGFDEPPPLYRVALTV